MICDLCTRRFDGIWDPDKTERLWPIPQRSANRRPSSLKSYDDDCSGRHNNNGNARLPKGRDDDHDDNTVNSDSQYSHDTARVDSSSDDDNEYGDTRSIHSQTSVAISEKSGVCSSLLLMVYDCLAKTLMLTDRHAREQKTPLSLHLRPPSRLGVPYDIRETRLRHLQLCK